MTFENTKDLYCSHIERLYEEKDTIEKLQKTEHCGLLMEQGEILSTKDMKSF